MSTVVKISINEDISAVLERVKQEYPTLNAPELFKLSLAELDRKLELEKRKRWAESLPVRELSEEEQASLTEAFSELDRGEGKLMTVDELMAEALSD